MMYQLCEYSCHSKPCHRLRRLNVHHRHGRLRHRDLRHRVRLHHRGHHRDHHDHRDHRGPSDRHDLRGRRVQHETS